MNLKTKNARLTMDKVPEMWRKDKSENVANNNNERFSFILPSLQKGNNSERC